MGENMNRGVVVALGGAAIIVAGLSGCSSDKASVGSADKASASVKIDGADQPVSGSVVCATQGGNFVITIGDATKPTQVVSVTMSSCDSPQVSVVALGNVGGTVLGFAKGAPGGEASVTKDGSSYTVTGKATGIDATNPIAPVTKPFEIKATCPS